MMTQLSPYLNFNGNCREAMTFYHSFLGGDLDLQIVEGSPFEAQLPPSMKHLIYHATLAKGPLILMASDMVGPDGFRQGNTISLTLNCASESEINDYYNRLIVDGKVSHALSEMFWGAIFATVTDRFGVIWMLNYDLKQNQ
jgi:PhnB protein